MLPQPLQGRNYGALLHDGVHLPTYLPTYLPNLVFFSFHDIVMLGHSATEVRRIVAHLLAWFQDAGVLVNIAKSHLEPVQNLIHLGVELDFIKGCVSIPGR